MVKLTNFFLYWICRHLPRSDCLEYGGWNTTSFPSCFNNFGHRGNNFLVDVWRWFFFLFHLFTNRWNLLFCFRVMVEHTSLQPQHILVLEMGMPWLHVLGSLLRCVFPFWLLINIKMISFGISLFYHSHASHKFCRIWSLYNFTQPVYMEQVALSQKVCSLSSICYLCLPFFFFSMFFQGVFLEGL